MVYAEIKGVARFKINPSRFVMVNRFLFAQKEPLAFYPLEGMELKMLLEEVKNGRLAPLTFALNKPGAYEEMLSPRIERDAIEKLRILSYIPEWNAYTVVATAEYSVCGGMSGSPVIRAQGSVVTNEIYGVISASFTSTRDEKESSRSNNTCAFAGLFIPNLYPNRFLPQF